MVPPPVEPAPGCGDGFCDGRTETCISCPKDCKCELQYLDKCITPGQLSLTFDDGPDQFSPTLLATAAHLKVNLTLFVIGNKLSNPTYQSYVKAYHRAGHTIASHTFTHSFVTKLSDAELRDEMIKTDDAIFKLIGVRPIFMRNPYSDTNERTMALLQSMGYKSIFTSLDTEDTVYGNPTPPTSLPTYVITQHETYNTSIGYLPAIVAEIKRRGYKIVPIDQCFGITGVYRNNRCGDGECSGYIENS
ncbi:chitin deacetylase [Massospora cicadina]|nr:chitin deacetylase [Massospora cicadina]